MVIEKVERYTFLRYVNKVPLALVADIDIQMPLQIVPCDCHKGSKGREEKLLWLLKCHRNFQFFTLDRLVATQIPVEGW